jgi:hypothetical protein
MPKLMRTLVLGAMVAALSSATAAVAQEPAATDQAVQQFRAGERASQSQPVAQAEGSSLAEQRRWYYESTRVQPAQAPAPAAEPGTPVGLLAALGAAAVLALSLDALAVRRKARKTAARAAT